jgi:molybdenum cofactor sulfurtransferase
MADVAPGCGGSGATWMVMLDAAKQCATHPPDLRLHKPHFVSLSFYKIFGYPTGLGALLVRRDALQLLLGSTGRPSYWGGGTIAAATATSDFVVRRSDVAALEHGTAAFTSAVAIPVGFAALRCLPGGVGAADAHACRVASRLVARLKGLRHGGIGGCACVVYGWDSHVASTAVVAYGPTVAFNVLASDGTIIPPASVEQALGLRSISLRSGQFCNPGAAASALGLSCDDITLAHERGHACGDAGSAHTGGSGGRVMGALRASFGYCSLAADADALVDALSEFFLSSHDSFAVTPPPMSLPGDVRIAALWLYPLKGAAGWSPPDGNWPLTRHGLAYDRVWAAVDPDGAVLTQTRCPQLGSVRPAIDIATGTLTLTLATGAQPPLVLPLDDAHDTNRGAHGGCHLFALSMAFT